MFHRPTLTSKKELSRTSVFCGRAAADGQAQGTAQYWAPLIPRFSLQPARAPLRGDASPRAGWPIHCRCWWLSSSRVFGRFLPSKSQEVLTCWIYCEEDCGYNCLRWNFDRTAFSWEVIRTNILQHVMESVTYQQASGQFFNVFINVNKNRNKLCSK